MYGTYRSTLYLLKSSNGTRFLTLVFASILLVSFGTAQNAFAHGTGPGGCPNRYDGPITFMRVTNGTHTIDPISNPDSAIQVYTQNSFNVTFVIHTPSQSSQGNSDNGTIWIHTYAIGFGLGVCHYGVGPDQDVTISESWGLPSQANRYHDSTSTEEFDTTVNGYHFVVNWIYPDAVTPNAPTDLSSTAVSPSQVNLKWNQPSNDGGAYITGYKIERSIDSGANWSIVVDNANLNATLEYDNVGYHYVVPYSDTGLDSSTTYTYRVSAINRIGTGPSSNTTSATTNATTPTGIILNNVQSTSGTTDSSNQITLSNFSATAGADRLLVVGVSANNNNVGSITFAGVPLTREVSHFTNNDAEFWYLTNPSGTGNITVTMNGPTQAVVGAYSFSGVNQTAPIPTHITRHNLSPSSPAISITTQYPNDWVLDLPSIYGGSTLGSPTCTQQWDLNVPNQITGASSSTMVQSPATVTCKWTASSADFWDDVAVELRAAG